MSLAVWPPMSRSSTAAASCILGGTSLCSSLLRVAVPVSVATRRGTGAGKQYSGFVGVDPQYVIVEKPVGRPRPLLNRKPPARRLRNQHGLPALETESRALPFAITNVFVRSTSFGRSVAAFHSTANFQKRIDFKKEPVKYYLKGCELPPVRGTVSNWSFYRFTPFPADQLEDLRRKLLEVFLRLNVRGRIYIASEGINAQVTCPNRNFEEMQKQLEMTLPGIKPGSLEYNKGMTSDFSFSHLHVRIRKALVNDGHVGAVSTLQDTTSQASHIPPAEFHMMVRKEMERAEEEGTDGPLIVDLRNHYENAVGRFDGAIAMDVVTYREGFATLKEELAKRDKDGKRPLFMYCTGGIRCTRSGSVLTQEGRENVFVLKGGITAYGRFLKQNPEIRSLYKGKNFTFDARLGEPITDHVLAQCQSCPPHGHDGKSAPKPCDQYVNCINRQCNALMIQCDTCQERYSGTCGSKRCLDALAMARMVNPLAGTRTQVQENRGKVIIDEARHGGFMPFVMPGSTTWHSHHFRSRPEVFRAQTEDVISGKA